MCHWVSVPTEFATVILCIFVVVVFVAAQVMIGELVASQQDSYI